MSDLMFPTEGEPFVVVDGQVRSKWVPMHGNHNDAADGSKLGLEMAYAGEALKQDHSGSVYWTAAGLHVYDGVIVARNLGQAAQLLVEAGWVSSGGIHWAEFSTCSDAQRAEMLKYAAEKLNFLRD